ncbi:MAG: hypothetical protein E7235_03085 [Lachnospiraceae bacterium]|nr:hypothetical protein [Lachnospiraceae bacterium]
MHEMKKNLYVEKNKLEGFKTGFGQQMETIYASAMQRQIERTNELENAKFTLAGVTYKDSKELADVKRCQEVITKAMNFSISKERRIFEAELKGFENTYSELISSCEQYIIKHKRPITASGKAILHLIKGTLSMAKQEAEQFRQKAEELYSEISSIKEEIVWGNILGNIRGSDFDLDNMKKVETGGAATSELKIITSGKKKFYFKAEEKLDLPENEYDKHILEEHKNDKNINIYRHMKALTIKHGRDGSVLDIIASWNPPALKKLKEATTNEKLMEAADMIKETLSEQHIKLPFDLGDIRFINVLKDILPKYELWGNRMDACEYAKISMGESLSKRNVLTTRMAAITKNPSLVASSNMATVHRGGEQKQKGIVMANAVGTEHGAILKHSQATGKRLVYTPEAIRQFSSLQLLDTVCGQIDRHYSNRFVTSEEFEDRIVIKSVQAIDHDLSFGNIKFEDLRFKNSHLPPIHMKGKFSIPALDEELVHILREMTKEDLKYYLGDLLDGENLDAMWNRLNGVNELIKAAAENDPALIVKKEDWNEDVAKRFVERRNLYIEVDKDNFS